MQSTNLLAAFEPAKSAVEVIWTGKGGRIETISNEKIAAVAKSRATILNV